MAALFKVAAELLKVIDLPVENDMNRTVFVAHGLITGFQVDDGKTAVAKEYAIPLMNTAPVRPAVSNDPCHPLDCFPASSRTGYSTNSAHQIHPYSEFIRSLYNLRPAGTISIQAHN
jgi:hypothetical protein